MKLWPFSLFERKALTDEQLLDLIGGGISTASGVSVSADAALRVPAVACAVRTIAEAAASLRVKVVEIGADGTETELPGHPVAALLRADANDWTSGFELIRQIVVDALCRDQGGMAWINRPRGEPVEIVRYRPGIIAADYDADGSGRAFYRINGRPVSADDIIHVKSTFERSPLTLAREAIGVASVMERHAGLLFGKGARPAGVLRTKKALGDDGVKRMIAGWRAAMEGVENGGKTAVLWDDAEWQQMQLSSVDAQFQELRLFQLQEIARAFNLPAVMLGDLSRATWSNSESSQKMMLMICLEPWIRALEGAFSRALFPADQRGRFGVRWERDDYTNVDLGARATAASTLISCRAMSPNEARTILLDLPKGPAELDQHANPNTGASQPGGRIGAAAPQTPKEPTP